MISEPQTLAWAYGKMVKPTFVSINRETGLLLLLYPSKVTKKYVGSPAINFVVTNAKNTIIETKRLIGKKFSNPEL